MPELPDLTVYIEHLEQRVIGQPLSAIRLVSPFVLRSVEPGVDELCGRRVVGCDRLAKQLVFELEDDYYIVIHLMISGRLLWKKPLAAVPKRNGLAAFDFPTGSLIFTEASKKKRASLRLVHGGDQLALLNPGGLEVLQIDLSTFAERLQDSNHTLKRALTDQHVFAGIGNAYSDEILLHAGLSPFKRPRDMNDGEIERLHEACCSVLSQWTDRLREHAGDDFPRKVTAFHPEMAVHGKYRDPVRYAHRRFSALFMRRMKPTIAQSARPAEGSWPTGRCRDC